MFAARCHKSWQTEMDPPEAMYVLADNDELEALVASETIEIEGYFTEHHCLLPVGHPVQMHACACGEKIELQT